MKKRSKLSRHQQDLTVEWMHLVRTLSHYFVQFRPGWQKWLYVDDLQGEGYLALAKAARTYDKARLPYPKAYFARAILNAMLKHIKRTTRMPGIRLTLEEAERRAPEMEEADELRLAIMDLEEKDRALAFDRFVNGYTIQAVATKYSLTVRTASLRTRRLAKILADELGIRLVRRGTDA